MRVTAPDWRRYPIGVVAVDALVVSAGGAGSAPATRTFTLPVTT
jgi:hypothetical protein